MLAVTETLFKSSIIARISIDLLLYLFEPK